MSKTGKLIVGLILGAATGFGIQQVQALPGTSIGYGQNPLVSIGGSAYHGETKVLFTAPADQDIIVKDVILTSFSNMTCKRSHKGELILGSGSVLAYRNRNGKLQWDTRFFKWTVYSAFVFRRFTDSRW